MAGLDTITNIAEQAKEKVKDRLNADPSLDHYKPFPPMRSHGNKDAYDMVRAVKQTITHPIHNAQMALKEKLNQKD